MGMTIGPTGGATAATPAANQTGQNQPNQAAFDAMKTKMEGQVLMMAEMPMITQMLNGSQDDGTGS